MARASGTPRGSPAADPPLRSRRRWRRIGLGAAAVGACGAAAIAMLVGHVPAFYRTRAVVADAAAADAAGRRIVSKLSALRADFVRPGSWEAVLAEDEVNAWLATDLPRNHAGLLPAGVSAPRVAFGPRRLRAGARVGGTVVGSVVSLDAEIVLRDVNQIGIVISAARVGCLPFPRGPVVREIGRRITALGMATDLRRADGGPMLVVSIPATHDPATPSHWLESLSLEERELLVAGVTRAARESRGDGAAGR